MAGSLPRPGPHTGLSGARQRGPRRMRARGEQAYGAGRGLDDFLSLAQHSLTR